MHLSTYSLQAHGLQAPGVRRTRLHHGVSMPSQPGTLRRSEVNASLSVARPAMLRVLTLIRSWTHLTCCYTLSAWQTLDGAQGRAGVKAGERQPEGSDLPERNDFNWIPPEVPDLSGGSAPRKPQSSRQRRVRQPRGHGYMQPEKINSACGRPSVHALPLSKKAFARSVTISVSWSLPLWEEGRCHKAGS